MPAKFSIGDEVALRGTVKLLDVAGDGTITVSLHGTGTRITLWVDSTSIDLVTAQMSQTTSGSIEASAIHHVAIVHRAQVALQGHEFVVVGWHNKALAMVVGGRGGSSRRCPPVSMSSRCWRQPST